MFGDLTRVSANFHAMEAWANLKKVNGDIGSVQSRLSTGKRINTAEDDTSGYALSKQLESRTRGLSQALDNVGTAKNVLRIAEGSYQAQMSILQRLKEKATQAADGSFSSDQRSAINDEYSALVERYHNRKSKDSNYKKINFYGSPFEYHRWETKEFQNIGSDNPGVVFINGSNELMNDKFLARIGYNYLNKIDKWSVSDQAADFLYIGNQEYEFTMPGRLGIIKDKQLLQTDPLINEIYLFDHFTYINSDDILIGLKLPESNVYILKIAEDESYQKTRAALFKLREMRINKPILFSKKFQSEGENWKLFAAIDLGGLFLDGFGDGLWLNSGDREEVETAFNILQATRIRISKTEYISCPSCGRTLFDLQETTAKVHAKTNHLKGVKIGIMGCIVNGPGEMADADFGYVGTGVGKISLYKGQEVVKKNVPTEDAVSELVDLIKKDGKWQVVKEKTVLA